jgi:hypothetical protein
MNIQQNNMDIQQNNMDIQQNNMDIQQNNMDIQQNNIKKNFINKFKCDDNVFYSEDEIYQLMEIVEEDIYNDKDNIHYEPFEIDIVRSIFKGVKINNIDTMNKKAIFYYFIGLFYYFGGNSDNEDNLKFAENNFILSYENGFMYSLYFLGKIYNIYHEVFSTELFNILDEVNNIKENDEEDDINDVIDEYLERATYLDITKEEIFNFCNKNGDEQDIFLDENKKRFKLKSENYFILYNQNINSYHSNYHIGYFYHTNYDYFEKEKAIQYFTISSNITVNDNNSFSLKYLGDIYEDNENYKHSLHYYTLYYQYCNLTYDDYDTKIEISHVLNKIGNIYKNMKNYKMAKKYLKKYKKNIVEIKNSFCYDKNIQINKLISLNKKMSYDMKCPICRTYNSFNFIYNKLINTSTECCICMENNANVPFTKCKHNICCFECIDKIKSRK